MWVVFKGQKTTMAATDVVSIDAAIASVLSELESISSLKEERRKKLKASLDGKDVLLLSRLALVRV